MLLGPFALLACELASEVIVRGLGSPVPDPVISIVLLLAVLSVNGNFQTPAAAEQGGLAKAADALLANLGLGISQRFGLILNNGVALVAALVVSMALTLIVTVTTFRAISRVRAKSAVTPL